MGQPVFDGTASMGDSWKGNVVLLFLQLCLLCRLMLQRYITRSKLTLSFHRDRYFSEGYQHHFSLLCCHRGLFLSFSLLCVLHTEAKLLMSLLYYSSFLALNVCFLLRLQQYQNSFCIPSELWPVFPLSVCEQWKKYWFVLTDHSLGYYKDSVAEEVTYFSIHLDWSFVLV